MTAWRSGVDAAGSAAYALAQAFELLGFAARVTERDGRAAVRVEAAALTVHVEEDAHACACGSLAIRYRWRVRPGWRGSRVTDTSDPAALARMLAEDCGLIRRPVPDGACSARRPLTVRTV